MNPRRGISSDGRALALHARGTGIDARILQNIFHGNQLAGLTISVYDNSYFMTLSHFLHKRFRNTNSWVLRNLPSSGKKHETAFSYTVSHQSHPRPLASHEVCVEQQSEWQSTRSLGCWYVGQSPYCAGSVLKKHQLRTFQTKFNSFSIKQSIFQIMVKPSVMETWH